MIHSLYAFGIRGEECLPLMFLVCSRTRSLRPDGGVMTMVTTMEEEDHMLLNISEAALQSEVTLTELEMGTFFSEIAGKGLQTGMGTIAGLGYGYVGQQTSIKPRRLTFYNLSLPLARLYANYFGGSLDLISLHGHGTDVFMKLRRLDQGGGIVI